MFSLTVERLAGPRRSEDVTVTADRGRTKPRKRWVKAARAPTFWTGLGLLYSIQVYLLCPEVDQ